MNLSDITAKAWILALFIRDDGERFLLGDGWYDFKDSLQHFQPDNIANDVVELQGADGQLLAGQVRRSGTQEFSGYVGDATTPKAIIETRRRDFLGFFQVRRKYKVVYIFPDGSAVQRQRGYLVEPATVQEMWQFFPEYHVALSFERVPYYEYTENSSGQEIYAHTLNLTALTEDSRLGSTVTLANVASAHLTPLFYQPIGNCVQDSTPTPTSPSQVKFVTNTNAVRVTDPNGYSVNYTLNVGSRNQFDASVSLPSSWNASSMAIINLYLLPNTTYTFSSTIPKNGFGNADMFFYEKGTTPGTTTHGIWNGQSRTLTTDATGNNLVIGYRSQYDGTTLYRDNYTYMLDKGATATAYNVYSAFELCKVGTARDLLWPTNSGWSLHKETGRIILHGTESGWVYNSTSKVFYLKNSEAGLSGYSSTATGYSPKLTDRFEYHAANGFVSGLADGLYENSSTTAYSILAFRHAASTSLADWKTWLASNPVTVFYVLATSTDTAIVNQTIINSLDNMRNMALRSPTTTITSYAEPNNAPITNYIRYYANTNEQQVTATSGGARPIWTVNGPATNPTLSNSSGTTITYNGTLESGDTLVVDMENQTAMINGAINAIANISGEWVEFPQGQSKVGYITDTNTGTSKIEWNGVVG